MKNKFSKIFFGLLLITSFVLAASISAFASDYYVDVKRGSDESNGSKTTPFKTIQKAADIVKPGDTVTIAPGVYYENVHLTTNGTKEQPIIFKAEKFERDSVIISGADKDIADHKVEWTLEDASLGLYSIPYPHPVYRMTANDVQIFEYFSLDYLKRYVYSSYNNPGYVHGFFNDTANKKLYIRLGKDECLPTDDPNSPEISIQIPRYATSNTSNWGGKNYGAQGQAAITGIGSFLFGVTTEESANVVISGITFKVPSVAAVWARCHDLTVSNCWFIGCIEGVRGGCAATADPRFISKNIIIEHCYYTTFPVYTDAIKIIKNFKDDVNARAIKLDANGDIVTDSNGKISGTGVPQVIWFWHAKSGMNCNFEGGGIACYIGENWTIRYNHFDDLLDGFSSFGNFSYWQQITMAGKTSLRQTPAKNLVIYGNKFDKVLDNSIEFEDNVQGIEIAYNEFTNQFSPFSWQPLGGTPYGTNINIHHNLVYGNPEEMWAVSSARNHVTYKGKTYRITSPQYLGLFKLGANKSDFSNLSWMIAENYPMDANGNPLDGIRPEHDGIRVWNNTFIHQDGAFEENVGSLGGGIDNNANIEFKNNIICVVVCAQDGTFKGGFKAGQAYTTGRGVSFTNNMLVAGLNIEASKEIGDITVSAPPRTTYAYEPIDDNGIYKDSIDKVGFKDWKNANFELTEDSDAIGAGVQIESTDESTVDLGAIPYGEKWVLTAGPYLEADINSDGVVDLNDIAELTYNVNSNEYTIRSDLDHNGIVDENDSNIMLEIYARNGGALK